MFFRIDKYCVQYINFLNMCLAVMLLMGCATGSQIIVRKPVTINLSDSYKDCYVVVHETDDYLEDTIKDSLNTIHIVTTVDSNSDLRVECTYNKSICLPWIGQSFDIHCLSLRNAMIKIIDNRRKSLLGEVLYRRSLLGTNPHGFVDKMFGAVLNKDVHCPWSPVYDPDKIKAIIIIHIPAKAE